MTVNCPRFYYRIVKYFIIYSAICAFLLLSLSYTIQSRSSSQLNLFQADYEQNLLFTNESSSLTYHIEQTKFYPHLPIQIYTSNRDKFLELQNKTKKIILLGNTFFHDPTWSIKSLKSKTNSGNMTELFCPFLSNHCEITTDQTRFKQADAVVYHLRDHIDRSKHIMQHRHPSQRFVFACWEPPINTPDLRSYNYFFNWTMTYRFDSHIFAPYYTDKPYRLRNNQWLSGVLKDYGLDDEITVVSENIDTTKKIGTAAALISNCVTASEDRMSLIRDLEKYVDVTIYGKCGKPCPESTRDKAIDCRTYIAEHYYFMLIFENSYCQDYTTEKLFSAITLPVVPVVFGRTNYTRYIPQSAFIDVRQFPSTEQLANRLTQIRNNVTLYQAYFKWKKDFIWNRFTHYMTPFCDLCLRLHLDQTSSIINNIHEEWFHKTCNREITTYFSDDLL